MIHHTRLANERRDSDDGTRVPRDLLDRSHDPHAGHRSPQSHTPVPALHEPLQQIPWTCGDAHGLPVGMQQSGTPDAEVHVDGAQQPMLMQERSDCAQQLPFSQL